MVVVSSEDVMLIQGYRLNKDLYKDKFVELDAGELKMLKLVQPQMDNTLRTLFRCLLKMNISCTVYPRNNELFWGYFPPVESKKFVIAGNQLIRFQIRTQVYFSRFS